MSLSFGLIGLGHHGRNAVAPAFYHPHVTVHLEAVCDVRSETLAAYDRPILGTYLDYREMLDTAVIDAVYVAAGMDCHHSIVLDCLNAGKHVVVEKPMAASLTQCQSMIDRARECGLVLAVNFESRYSKQNEVLTRWIAEGHFGQIEAMHFANMWDGHKRFGPIKARRDRLMELAGALDCGIHKLDQARFLVGGTWTHVTALGSWLDEPSKPPPHIGVLGQLSNGVMVTLTASLAWAAMIKPRPMINTMEIAGTDGVALCRSTPDLKTMTMQLFSSALCEEVTFESSGHTSDIVMLLNDFHRVVRNPDLQAKALARGEDGYWAQLATEEANNSAIDARIPLSKP